MKDKYSRPISIVDSFVFDGTKNSLYKLENFGIVYEMKDDICLIPMDNNNLAREYDINCKPEPICEGDKVLLYSNCVIQIV